MGVVETFLFPTLFTTIMNKPVFFAFDGFLEYTLISKAGKRGEFFRLHSELLALYFK